MKSALSGSSSAPSALPLFTAHLCTSCGMDVAPCHQRVLFACGKSTSNKRKELEDSLTLQTKRMKVQSDRNFSPPKVGDTVRVHILQVVSGKTDAWNVLAYVIKITLDNFFKLCIRNGILKQSHARSQFELSHENFLTVDDLPRKERSFRWVATAQAVGNCQGFVRCSCIKKMWHQTMPLFNKWLTVQLKVLWQYFLLLTNN